MVGGACGATEPEPAKFNRFIVWNCEKGLEFVNAGSLQFHDCLLVSGQDCQLKLAVLIVSNSYLAVSPGLLGSATVLSLLIGIN